MMAHPSLADVVIVSFRPEHAEGITACVRQIYGESYPRSEMYDPDAIIARNQSGILTSAVAVDPRGEVVGHSALERVRQDDAVAEAGMTMVMPRFRGKGLHARLRDFLVERASNTSLAGIWADIATSDTAAQSILRASPGRPCGISLNLWPSGSHEPPAPAEHSRASFLFHFRFIDRPALVNACVPDRYREVVVAILEQFGIPVEFQPDRQVAGRGGLDITADRAKQCAFLQARNPGNEALVELEAAVIRLDDEGIEASYLDLPLSDPGTSEASRRAEELGFFFSGVAPLFFGDDSALRLQRVRSRPDFSRIQLINPFARWLLAYVRTEYERPAPHAVSDLSG